MPKTKKKTLQKYLNARLSLLESAWMDVGWVDAKEPDNREKRREKREIAYDHRRKVDELLERLAEGR